MDWVPDFLILHDPAQLIQPLLKKWTSKSGVQNLILQLITGPSSSPCWVSGVSAADYAQVTWRKLLVTTALVGSPSPTGAVGQRALKDSEVYLPLKLRSLFKEDSLQSMDSTKHPAIIHKEKFWHVLGCRMFMLQGSYRHVNKVYGKERNLITKF